MDLLKLSPEEAIRMVRGLEHLFCGDGLGELGLEKRRLWGNLAAPFGTYREHSRELERDSSQGHVMIGQG